MTPSRLHPTLWVFVEQRNWRKIQNGQWTRNDNGNGKQTGNRVRRELRRTYLKDTETDYFAVWYNVSSSGDPQHWVSGANNINLTDTCINKAAHKRQLTCFQPWKGLNKVVVQLLNTCNKQLIVGRDKGIHFFTDWKTSTASCVNVSFSSVTRTRDRQTLESEQRVSGCLRSCFIIWRRLDADNCEDRLCLSPQKRH